MRGWLSMPSYLINIGNLGKKIIPPFIYEEVQPVIIMSDIISFLKQIRTLPTLSRTAFVKIDRELCSKWYIRYRTLERVEAGLRQVLEDAGAAFQLPKHTDLLSMTPIEVGGELYRIDKIVENSFKLAATERDKYIDSIIDILRLYRCSFPINVTDIDDISTVEFITRIPNVGGGDRRYIRRTIVGQDRVVYFVSTRIMVTVSYGVGEGEDQNYFISVIDLGSFFQFMFRDGEGDFSSPISLAHGRFKRSYFTGRPRNVNTNMTLWDEVKTPVKYYWFVCGNNIRRQNYTFEIEFVSPMKQAYALPLEEWDGLKREFGIPDTLGFSPRDAYSYENAGMDCSGSGLEIAVKQKLAV